MPAKSMVRLVSFGGIPIISSAPTPTMIDINSAGQAVASLPLADQEPQIFHQFSELPSELRDRIYFFYLQRDPVFRSKNRLADTRLMLTPEISTEFALILANHEIGAEFRRHVLVHHMVTFELNSRDTESFDQWWVTPSALSQITRCRFRRILPTSANPDYTTEIHMENVLDLLPNLLNIEFEKVFTSPENSPNEITTFNRRELARFKRFPVSYHL